MPKRLRYKTTGINELYQRWLFAKVRNIVRPSLVINFDHTANQLWRYFADAIYFCNDYHIRNFGIAPIRSYFEYCERVVASRSRLCFGTCEFLRQRLAMFNPNSYELRLGAPEAIVPPIVSKSSDSVKLALVDFTQPGKTPLDLLQQIGADERFVLHLFGPVDSRVRKRFRGASNVRFEGVVQGQPLLSALRSMDVGIAIYKPDDGNPGCTPNKMWQYLAAGDPMCRNQPTRYSGLAP